MEELTHFNPQGHGHMVNVQAKNNTQRIAIACASIQVQAKTFEAIQNMSLKKGDVLAVAQIAGVMAVKKTWELIPLAHPLQLNGIDIRYELDADNSKIHIECEVHCEGKTGVEMEALTGASICALTIYDMVKAMDKGMVIENIYLKEKIGGKSGYYERGTL
jgi:cyclic pyranopterin phosphate synthase